MIRQPHLFAGKRAFGAAFLLLTLGSVSVAAREVRVTLRGSPESMQRQNRIARAEDFSFLRTNRDVNRFADAGRLIPVPGNEDYQVLADWPYARPVVRSFVELLARDYRAGCGEPLVVTSLTRPVSRQPANASPLSVHPAGMAVDLRVSARGECVRWLETELLQLEAAGLLDGTREYHPPHFHVAVFPEEFSAFLAERAADSLRVVLAREDSLRRVVAAERLRALAAAAPAGPHLTAAGPGPGSWTPAALLGDLLALMGRLLLRV